MKHKLRTILFVLVLMFSFMLNVNAEIKENVNEYTGDMYIIGSSRFDSRTIVTGTMASAAGARETMIQYNIYGNYDFDPADIRIYYYSGEEEAWSLLPVTSEDEMEYLTEEETEELEENLNIYFVNEIEKTLEVEYDIELEEGYELEFWTHSETYAKKIKYEEGKLIIPASIGHFEMYAVKGDPESEDGPYEEVYLGSVSQDEGEFNVSDIGVKTYDELMQALNNGVEHIQITESIDLPTALEIDRFVSFYVENGVELTISKDTEGYGVFHVVEGGDLYISGSGTIDGCGDNEWNLVVFAEAGRVTIAGGTYTNKNLVVKPDDTDADHFDVIYAKGTAEIIIDGGRFEGKTPAWLLNVHDGSRKTASITVRGGQFEGFDPSNNAAEGEGTSFLADGYKVSPMNGVYTVMPISKTDVAMVSSVAYTSLQEAFNYVPEKGTVKVIRDIDLSSGVVVSKEVTLDLNGYTIDATDEQSSTSLIKVEKPGKLTITGNGTIDSASQGNDYSMAVWARNGGEVIIENGTFTNLGGKAFEDDGVEANNNELIYASGGGKVTINGGRYIGNTDNKKWGTRYTLNLQDNSGSEILVKGGEYVALNPADSKSEPETKNFLADGYKVIEKDGVYTVVELAEDDVIAINGVAYTSFEDAIKLLKDKDSVKLLDNITTDASIVIDREVTIDGNGKTISFNTMPEKWITNGDNYVLKVYNTKAVIKNINLTNSLVGLLVQSSDVTLQGTINVSGNSVGGVEISKSSNEGLPMPKLVTTGATIINDAEDTTVTMWEDGITGTVTTELKKVDAKAFGKENQTFYFNNIPTTAEVKSLEAFKYALSNGFETIKLIDNITTDASIVIDREVTIDGNGKTISFNTMPEKWITNGDNYVLKVYNTKAVIKNINLTNSLVGLLVQSSDVTLQGTINVSGNSVGGIEVSKSSNEGLPMPKLVTTGATIINDAEGTTVTMWEDVVTGTVTTELKKVDGKEFGKENQTFYFNNIPTTE